jgi:lipopolysaccharide biosynthesis glycosyltransferase
MKPNFNSFNKSRDFSKDATARPPTPSKKRCAYATIHFGSNPVYLELELYFFRMLRQYTNYDILYLYSVNDTPASFVDAIKPLVTRAIPYDDKNVTFDVSFKSGYANFNTLRTCNFIFAYTLEQYDTVCIIESDMVLMRSIDSIFDLQSPALLTYYIGSQRLSSNNQVINKPKDVLDNCREMGRVNGGVMLINPSRRLFDTYKSKIVDVVERECKYPNETLFEYVNNRYFNLPIQYNMSHFLAKPDKLAKYNLSAKDVMVFHFNETKYKHLDIIKTPFDEEGNDWLKIIQRDKKYEVKKFPILHYKSTIYDRYNGDVGRVMKQFEKKPEPPPLKVKTPSPPSPKKDELRKGSPLILKTPSPPSPKKDELRKGSPLTLKEKTPDKDESIKLVEKSPTLRSLIPVGDPKKTPCPKGTRRNKKTGICEPYTKKSKCPEGTKRSRITGNCEPIGKKPKCPKGTHRSKKTGNCEPNVSTAATSSSSSSTK